MRSSPFHTKQKAKKQIPGESLLNDGTAFVIFQIVLEIVKGENPSVGDVVVDFVHISFGGTAVGIVFGIGMVWWLAHTFQDPKIEISLSVLAAYLGEFSSFYFISGKFEKKTNSFSCGGKRITCFGSISLRIPWFNGIKMV